MESNKKQEQSKNFFEKYQPMLTIKSNVSIQLLELPKNHLLSLSKDSELEIYELQFFQKKLKIPNTIHSDTINRVTLLKKGNLVTTSSDKLINILSINLIDYKYEIIQTLIGHTLDVWMCLELSDGNLATSSNDKTIRVWFYNNEEKIYEPLQILDTSPDEVGEMIETKNKILITCSVFDAYYQVQFWDIEKYEKIGVVEEIATCGCNDLIQINDDIICVNGSRDEAGLQFISISKMELLKRDKGFNNNLIDCFYLLKDGSFLVGYGNASDFNDFNNEDNSGSIQSYKVSDDGLNFELISEKKCHNYPVICILELNSGDVVSGSTEIIYWKKL